MNHSHVRPAADDHVGHAMGGVNSLALSATLHCLTGCAIGEILGLMIGTAIGLSTGWTIVLAVSLAFLFGYALSTLPLLKAGLGARRRARGGVRRRHALHRHHGGRGQRRDGPHPRRDGGRAGQRRVLGEHDDRADGPRSSPPTRSTGTCWQRGKGHALTHEYHGAAAATGARRYIPTLATSTLVGVIVAFMLGGLVVSIAAEHRHRRAGADAPRVSASLEPDVAHRDDLAFVQPVQEGAVDPSVIGELVAAAWLEPSLPCEP